MAVASFEGLCAGLCDLVGIATPRLKEDSVGRVGFHVVLRGATVNLVHCPHACPDYVFVLFEFGPLGQDGPDAAAGLQALMDANFAPLQVNPPVFSRNPDTGDVLLQCVFKLFDSTPHDLHALIERGVVMVEQWRPGGADDDVVVPVDPGSSSMQARVAHDISRFA
ncbi:CesT family type III secretion system chaperone [Caenimonas sp. SL110]|uniref:CesT family type III secretion system chaperone n=1 Tax=Caenimonas sp. SL110 TaxID=1450524 RepID=UPI000653194F|nr:CesT family type III secretion system chaperone [Caenimonas sp. SL110]